MGTADAQAFTLLDTDFSENVGTASIRIQNATGTTQFVTWSTGNGTAMAGSDYTAASSTSAFILSNGANGTASIMIADDDINEGDETIIITVNHRPTGGTLTSSSFTVTILDNDPPGVTLTPTSVAENAGWVTFTASMEGNALSTPSPTQVGFFTEEISSAAHPATNDQDYDGALSFNDYNLDSANNYRAQFRVHITDDTADEENETFGIVLRSSNGTTKESTHVITIEDDDAPPTVSLNAVSTGFAESGGTATVTAALSAASGKEITVGYRTENGSAAAGQDYDAASGTLTFAPGETNKDIVVQISNDDRNEGAETFAVVLLDDANLANATLGAANAVRRTVTIADNDPPGVSLTPIRIRENVGTAVFTLSLNGEPIAAGEPTFRWRAHPGTALEYDDYEWSLQGSRTVASSDGSPTTFSMDIVDDEEIEGDETFFIEVRSPDSGQGAGTIATLRQQVTILDDDGGPDPILAEISNHLVAKSVALMESQPRLTDNARNGGNGSSGFELRASSAGLEALDGGIAGESFWGEATFSRSGSLGSDGDHLAASLGAHRQVSDRMFLGGMLQFDRTSTKLEGGGRSGEFSGEGWMVGPYVVARDPSKTLFLEGRLLYGRASHDAEAVVAEAGDDPRYGSFDGERWIAQARVEGERRLGNGAIMYPLADLSHAKNVGNGFDETVRENPDLETDLHDAVRTAVSKLQLGTEFEMPLDPARGDLTFRPGLKLVFADRDGGPFGESERSAAGRVDFRVDYRLETGVSLGFQGYYSGLGGGSEFESYGAGLRLRMRF